jgi:hypothetical protein
MINLNKFENRIVKFKRISTTGDEVPKEAELRGIDYEHGIPHSITIRLADPLNVVAILSYDDVEKKFIGTVGTFTWISDFDWRSFLGSNSMNSIDTYIRKPSRFRPKK